MQAAGGTSRMVFPNGSIVEGTSSDCVTWAWTIAAGPNGAMPPGYVANDPRWPGATVK